MITSYYYKGPEADPWEYEEVNFEKLNLLVGTSGSGKTKFLNTIFNFSSFVIRGEPFKVGYWKLSVSTEEFEYFWEYDGQQKTKGKNEIQREIVKRRDLNSQNDFEILIDRSINNFLFCGSKLPKLQVDKPSVTLLKEEEKIKPFYDTFAKVQRRNFHDDGLSNAIAIQNVPSELIQGIKSGEGIREIWKQDNALNAKIFLLKEYHSSLYKLAVDTFKGVFTAITECDVQMMKTPPISLRAEGVVPVFIIKEKGVNKWIALHELSSGMQKVLLIITDIITLPKGSIYLIDEYENSLGINAIDFLPQFLLDSGENIQFFITTHHPYLINSMPMKSWRVFHRLGSKVSIKKGEDFERKYGKSKQKAFIQLINDPFYLGNI